MNSTSSLKSDQPLRVAIVGVGKRVESYAQEALKRPDWLKIVAVAEPNAARRDLLGDEHGVPHENRMASYADLAARPGLVDAVINTTTDGLHYESTMPLIRAGYHVLLEKPIALEEQHVRDLIAAAREHQRIVMICHGMRYNPFYQKTRELLQAGAIGKLRSLHAAECVAYHHIATTFIRSQRYAGFTPTPMLMQKCCHDMDMIAWLAGEPAKRVASFVTPTRFVPANAPAGSTDRCLNGCAVEATCPFSARKMYVDDDMWDECPWPVSVYGRHPTAERKIEVLKTDNLYGRCVWRTEHTTVDHQNVLIEFASGMTATFDMFCATARGYRTLHLVGTEGEIVGDADTGILKLRHLGPQSGAGYTEETFHLKFGSGGHNGADRQLLGDFVAVMRGDPAAKGWTRIENSLAGHQIVFAAEKAVREGRVVEIK